MPLYTQITVCEKPVTGTVCTIQTNSNDTSIVITYRPNSNIEKKEVLKSNNSIFEWIPKKEGVVSIKSSNETINVSVRYQNFSVSGLFVLLFAGTVLFGGVAIAFRVLFKQ